MIKKFLLFLLIVASIELQAQEKVTKNFSIGVNLGPNYNSLRGDMFADKYNSQFNYFFGLSLEFIVNENVSLLTNFNYETRSYKAEYSFSQVFANTPTFEDKTTIKNLNIPLHIKI